MPRKTNINYMMRLVKKFIDDPEASRYVFEDMVYLELEKRYRLMASEDREYAEVFYDYIVENGTDAGDSLSDSEYRDLIAEQYYEVKDIAASDFY